MRSFRLLLILACVLIAGHAFADQAGMDKAPVNILPSMNTWIQYGLQALAIVLGLVIVFAGYRLFKIILFICGFVLFYYICYNVLTTQVLWAPFWILLISGGSGLLGGFFLLGLGLAAFKIAAFIFGFIGGSMMAYLAVAVTPLAGVMKNAASNSRGEFWVIVGVILGVGLVFGIVTAILSRALLILITSCVGAFVVGTAVDAIAFNSVESQSLRAIVTTRSLPPIMTITWGAYLILSGVVVLAVAGIVVQARGTAKHYHHRHGYHPPAETQPLLIQDNY